VDPHNLANNSYQVRFFREVGDSRRPYVYISGTPLARLT